jgi:transposase InsO family protein
MNLSYPYIIENFPQKTPNLQKEDVYLRAYETPAALRIGLTHYFQFYNTERRHQALNRQTPDAVYWVNPKAKKAA